MKKLIYKLSALLGISLMLFACSDILEVDNTDVLTIENNYQDINDANNAVLGVYAMFQDLAPQLIVLNELRADLMDVTYNADHYMKQISTHDDISGDNPWADARPFFKIINNCNDVMVNLAKMYDTKKITREEYQHRYSDIASVRSWLYLQMVIHYGEVPYITTPIDRIEDLNIIKTSEAPVLDLETMVDTLVNFVQELPYLSLYDDIELLQGSDGFNFLLSFIDKDYLLGELYLWNDDYLEAATKFKEIMTRTPGDFDEYKLPTDFFNFTHYFSRYTRYKESDIESAVNNWGTMFSTYGGGDYYDEWIWVMYYHGDLDQTPLMELFSKNSGNYYFKPSQLAIDNWGSQLQANGFLGDFRGGIEDPYGNSGSYKLEGNDPVITKYISDFDITEPFKKPGKWFLWRATSLHLRFAEAANRDVLNCSHKVPYALLNNGIASNFAFPGDKDTVVGDFPWEQTSLPAPYDFDARQTNGVQVPVTYRGLWYRNTGIRARVSLRNFTVPEGADSLLYIEDKILEENALELAYEGERWGDLVRISLRRNDPSILANHIADKFEKAGDLATASKVRARLMDQDNWWLPLFDEIVKSEN